MYFTRVIQLIVGLGLALFAPLQLAYGADPTFAPAVGSTAPLVQTGPALFAAKINFQPAGAATPAGYLADTGAAYGSRGNGYTYGWSGDNSANMRDRNALADQRYDTLAHLQVNGTFTWQVAVPNGRYTVRLVAGDPNYFNSVYHFMVEGVAGVNCTPTSTRRWCEATQAVTVTDGRLTITNGSGAVNNKIDFIEISQHWSAYINFQPAGASVPTGYLADAGQPFRYQPSGHGYGWNADNTANMRDRNVASDQRYDTLAHMQLNGSFAWRLALPNGSYDVRIVAGDPSYFNSVYSIDANGVPVVRGTPTSQTRWIEGTAVLNVTSGGLILTSGAGAVNNKINFIEILAQRPPSTEPPPIFADDFNRPDSPSVGPAWVQSWWQIRGGTAYTFERGFAQLVTAQSFAAASYVLETRALGFGPTIGPSPADSTDFVFGGSIGPQSIDLYRVLYYPSASGFARLQLERVSTPPGSELQIVLLDEADIQLPTDRWLQWKVVRDGPGGLIQVFIDMGDGYYQPIPVLEATDTTYTTLGQFGWVLESEAPGDFNVDWIKATAP